LISPRKPNPPPARKGDADLHNRNADIFIDPARCVTEDVKVREFFELPVPEVHVFHRIKIAQNMETHNKASRKAPSESTKLCFKSLFQFWPVAVSFWKGHIRSVTIFPVRTTPRAGSAFLKSESKYRHAIPFSFQNAIADFSRINSGFQNAFIWGRNARGKKRTPLSYSRMVVTQRDTRAVRSMLFFKTTAEPPSSH